MLSGGKTKDISEVGEREAVTVQRFSGVMREMENDRHGSVGGDLNLLLQGELCPVCGIEGFGAFWRELSRCRELGVWTDWDRGTCRRQR